MSKPMFLSAAELPPKPDPDTGEPRPPRAPGFRKEDKPPKEQDRDRDRRLSRKPSPPDGQGPVLEWYRSSQRNAVIVGLIGFGIMTVGVTLMQGGDLRWMGFWWTWATLALFAFFIYTATRSTECSVGAEWLQAGKSWVHLYELTKIKSRFRSHAVHIDFTDHDGREVQISSSDIQEDRDMWDLVYNGMLHSIIAGEAETNGMTHHSFQLPRRHGQN